VLALPAANQTRYPAIRYAARGPHAAQTYALGCPPNGTPHQHGALACKPSTSLGGTEKWTPAGKFALAGAFSVILFGAFYMMYWVPRHGRSTWDGARDGDKTPVR
jgi:hypothetical protein